MGVSCFHTSSARYPNTKERASEKLPNPNPANYEIIMSLYDDDKKFLLVLIKYPDCTNYEGKKILLYKNTTIENLKKQKLIDPHFSDNKKYISPIARFEPTSYGWECGVTLIKTLTNRI